MGDPAGVQVAFPIDRRALVGLGLTAGVFVLDVVTPLGLAAGVLHTASVALTFGSAGRRSGATVAAVAAALTVGAYFLAPAPAEPRWIVVGNRALSLLAVAVVAAAADRAHRARAAETALFEAAPDLMLSVGRDGAILRANARARPLLGYEPEELAGRPVESLVPAAARPGLRESLARSAAVGPAGAGASLAALGADGALVPVDVTLAPAGDRTVVAVRDARERRRMRAALERRTRELERSNAELEQLAYVASHDLQEPLRMVASYTELLARQYAGKLDDKGERYAGYVVEGTRRMQQMIDDLLAYSRVEASEPPDREVPLGELAEQVLHDLSAALGESGAEVTRGDLPVVRGDRGQLGQVLQNLLSNAIKYRSDRPLRVRVACRREGDEHVVSVADNGIGFDLRFAGRVFEMFQRLHDRATYPGTGIGLAVARRIVERHGGRMWVESAPGEGSTFFFSLPVEGRQRA